MPSSSAKQHRFMQAVAHSPSFAKKVGVSQSVGKDFSAADKGKTFNKGGMMKKGKRFNGEDGESEVEYHDYDPDKTYSGRFTDDETGGLAENTPTRSTAKAVPAAPSRAPAARAAPAATASSSGVNPAQEAARAAPAAEDKSRPKATAQEGRYRKTGNESRGAVYLKGTPAEQEAEGEKRMDVVMAAMPLGKLGLLGKTAGKPALQTIERQLLTGPARTGQYLPAARNARLEGSKARLEGPKARLEGPKKSSTIEQTFLPYGGGGKAGGNVRSSFGNKKNGAIMEPKSMKFAMGGGMPPPGGTRPDPRMMAAMRAQQAARQQPMRRPPPGGMPPPAQPPMGMKKGGMPMKDGKPAFMQKKMMGGGMAKYAKGGSIRRMADGGMTAPMAPPMAPQQPPVDPRQMAAMQAAMQAQGGAAPMAPGMKRGGSVGFAKGGGIESRGKTKGTVIRMAAGGSVSSRADGIAQRGKTKFTNY